MTFRKPRQRANLQQRNARQQVRAARRAAQHAARRAIARAAASSRAAGRVVTTARAGNRFVAAARAPRCLTRPLGPSAHAEKSSLAQPPLAGKAARSTNRIDDANRFDPRLVAARRRFNPGLKRDAEVEPKGGFKAKRNSLRATVHAESLARERAEAAVQTRRRKVTRIRSRTVMKPLVLERPVIRAGAEDYRQHPSRLTPVQWEAYWAPEKLSA